MRNLDFIGYKDYAVTTEGKIFSLKSDRFLKPYTSSGGYYQVQLNNEHGRKTFMLHRIVAEAFLGSPDSDIMQVNHKDGDKSNNVLSNLEWVTPKENVKHCVYTLGKSRKVNDDDVHTVCKYIQDGMRVKDISEMTGVERHIVSNIKSGKSFTFISNEYDFSNCHKKSKTISDSKVMKICEMLQAGECYHNITLVTGANRQQVYDIKKRKYFTKISQNYDF